MYNANIADIARLRAIANSVKVYSDTLDAYAIAHYSWDIVAITQLLTLISAEANYGLQFLNEITTVATESNE